jgi:hypothetical protein
MEKEFIPYEQSLALKELGFNEPCMARFSLGLEQHNTTQLQFVLDHSLDKGTNIPIENDFFPTSCYNKGMYIPTAPLYQQAFRWFREVYGLKHDIDDDKIGKKFYYKIRSYTDKFDNYDDIIKPMREERDWSKIEFYSYEEAELACLIKLIEIVKNK